MLMTWSSKTDIRRWCFATSLGSMLPRRSWDRETHLAARCEDRFLAATITMVARTIFVIQVVAQLGRQHSFGQHFLEWAHQA